MKDQAGDTAQGSELEQEVSRLTAERDDLNQRYLRTLADYQNAQRRALRDQEEAKRQGLTAVVLNVLNVVDHFDLALMQDPSKATVEQIIKGVQVIRDELMKVLQGYGVGEINPQPDDEFDPHRHQAVMQTETDSVRTGHIVNTLQTGYSLGDRVIRPARVSIRPMREEDPGDLASGT